MFADDAKILEKMRNLDDCHDLQEDLDKISVQSNTWQIWYLFTLNYVQYVTIPFTFVNYNLLCLIVAL